MARVDSGELRDIILSLCEGEVARRRKHIDYVNYPVGNSSNIGRMIYYRSNDYRFDGWHDDRFDGWYIITLDEWDKGKPSVNWPEIIVGVPGMPANGKFLTCNAAQDFVHQNLKYFQHLSYYIVIHVVDKVVIDAEYADETRDTLERIEITHPVYLPSSMYNKWCVVFADTVNIYTKTRVMGSFDKIDQALNFISKNKIHPSQVMLINAMSENYTRCVFYPDDPRLIRYKKQLEIMVRMPKQYLHLHINKNAKKIKKQNNLGLIESPAKLGWYIFSQSEFINGSGIEDSYIKKSTLYYNSDPYHDYVTAQQMAKKMLGFKDKILVFVDENSIAKGAVYSSHPADLWLHWWPFWDKQA